MKSLLWEEELGAGNGLGHRVWLRDPVVIGAGSVYAEQARLSWSALKRLVGKRESRLLREERQRKNLPTMLDEPTRKRHTCAVTTQAFLSFWITNGPTCVSDGGGALAGRGSGMRKVSNPF